MDNEDGKSGGKLKYLLIIGILAIVVGLGGELVLLALDPARAAHSEPSATSRTVLAGQTDAPLTWEDLIGGTPAPDAASDEPQSADAQAAAPVDVSISPDAMPTDANAPVQETEPTATRLVSTSATARPVVLENGGIVPYSDNYFTVTTSGVEDAGGMKVLRTEGLGQETMFQGISWRLDIDDADMLRGRANGVELGDKDLVGTGTVLELLDANNAVIDTAIVVVPGDVLGSGQINEAQLIALQAAVADPNTLTGVYSMAADINGNGTIDSGDVDLLQAQLEEAASTASTQGE